ncbi:TonB family protein [Pantoea ananatis]|uniref:TonB family protein n=1 Tax=Pantoea ananas TaxID=553 RepID=UPI001FF3DDED|nr:TonB family protein [Pantoea ananatis]MCK0554303.1 TonB family protein [Pantoea ananatis]
MRIIITCFLLFLSFSSSANVIKYPQRAESLRIDGTVKLLYDIDVNGSVINVRIIKSEPEHIFDRTVVKQISKWKFPKNESKKDVELNIIFDANHKFSSK